MKRILLFVTCCIMAVASFAKDLTDSQEYFIVLDIYDKVLEETGVIMTGVGVYAVNTQDPEAVVEIFAAVYAKRCIIMADPMMPEKVLSEAVAGADKFVINIIGQSYIYFLN